MINSRLFCIFFLLLFLFCSIYFTYCLYFIIFWKDKRTHQLINISAIQSFKSWLCNNNIWSFSSNKLRWNAHTFLNCFSVTAFSVFTTATTTILGWVFFFVFALLRVAVCVCWCARAEHPSMYYTAIFFCNRIDFLCAADDAADAFEFFNLGDENESVWFVTNDQWIDSWKTYTI